MKSTEENGRMLVIRLSAMGDVAMTVPVLHSLMKKYPSLNLVVLTTYGYDPMFDNLPNVKVKHFDRHGGDKGLFGIFKVWWRLRSEYKFKYIADLHGVLRSRLLCFLFRLSSRAKIVHIDKGRKEKRELVSKGAKGLGKPLKNGFERYKQVFREMGFQFPLDFHSIYDGKKIILETDFLNQLGGEKRNGEKWIGVAPFAGHKGKIYPLKQMGQLIDLLGQHEDYRIFLFGHGEGEKSVMHKWAKRNGENVRVMPPHTYLPDELRLMSKLDVMISMDSANMHLASLVDTKVVSIWGATHYYAGFLGWKQNEGNIVDIDLSCRPCSIFGNVHCHKKGDSAYECLHKITPEMIEEKIELAVSAS